MKYRSIKQLLSIAFYSLLAVVFSSCDDFLDEEPLSRITVDQLYNTDADLEQAIAGVYANLSNNDMYRQGRMQYFLELRSDAMMLGTQRRGSSSREPIATFNYTADHGFTRNMWSRHYNGINNANIVIEKTPEAAAASERGKSRILAEAHFLRAFLYFNLVRLWGDVPLLLNSASTFEEARDATRDPADAIYAQIILDAKTAAGEMGDDIILPAIGNNDGRLTLSAAQTLLAEVYLTLKDYAASAEYAKKVIDDGTHALWEEYADAFDVFKQYSANSAPNAETVFDVKFYQEIDPGSRFATDAWPRRLVLPYSATPSRNGAGNFEVHQSTYNRLEDNDVRKQYMFPKTYALGTGRDAILVPDEDTIKGGPYTGLAFNQEPPYFCAKYRVDDDPLLRFTWAQHPWPIYRYADVLLYYLEAMNEQGLVTQDILDLTINQTRGRGKLDPISTTAQGELREIIKEERLIEFFFEGKRFFDLVRWGDLVETINSRDFDYVNQFPIDERYYFLPIPQREFDANPNLGENNPPWN